MAIRGTAKLMRYVRFVCKQPGPAARLSEIEAFAAKPPS
jgi:hypothetical protein